MLKVGLLEDDDIHTQNWSLMLEGSSINVELHCFKNHIELFEKLDVIHTLDVLILDRMIKSSDCNAVDIFDERFIKVIQKNFKGKVIYFSNSKIAKEDKVYVDLILKNKFIRKIEDILKSLDMDELIIKNSKKIV